MSSWIVRAMVWWLFVTTSALGADLRMPLADEGDSIAVRANRASHWTQGAYDVWLLQGDCRIRQGAHRARCEEAVLWMVREQAPEGGVRTRLISYLETGVELEYPDIRLNARPIKMHDKDWFGEFATLAEVRFDTPTPGTEPQIKPPVYEHGVARREPRSHVAQVQFTAPADPAAIEALPPGTRRIRAYPRSAVPVRTRVFPSQDGKEWIATIDSGVNLIIDGIDELGSLDASADRIVLWTSGLSERDLTNNTTVQGQDVPLEIYLEGNIIFRQGDREIQAQRMYYNAVTQSGTVIDAEVLTPIAEYGGLVKFRSELLQITGRDRFVAQNSYITSSRMASPGYRLEAGTIYVEDIQRPVIDPLTGQVARDPVTGDPVIDHQRQATSRNNRVYIGPVPVFYWPTIATDLSDPSFYLTRALVKNDRIFGTQFLTTWDMYQILGVKNRIPGTRWLANADYFTKRGAAGGTAFRYELPSFFGIQGPNSGMIDAWAIPYDHGLDTLGLDRVDLFPEKRDRYRILGRHRQMLPGDYQLSAELGYISDRNFLEMFYEKEYDEFKDQTTGMELKKLNDNMSWSVTVDDRINHFWTDTKWLPRGDHFSVGVPLLGDWITWTEHSTVGNGRLRLVNDPLNPSELAIFQLLPWEATAQGTRAVTRHEIDLPFSAGAFRIVPFALGELGHWDEGLSQTEANTAAGVVNRAYGAIGTRASLPFWSANPGVESSLFNVHGLAHKVVLDAEVSLMQSNQPLTALPLYDNIDDNAIEWFRQRFATNTYGGTTPIQFDERYYALRSGLAGWVTSPVPEIAGDMTTVRFGARQRLQTKRGLPGQRRIIDWMILDAGATWFPDPSRDNFGRGMGLVNYDFRWNVGDRFTILSDAAFDFFQYGQHVVTVGTFITRPPRGSMYIGFRWIEGIFRSEVITASYNYQMSPKWMSTFGTSFDVAGNGNIGQNFSITRIGESFLTSFGFNVDAYKHNVGVTMLIEPRFLPKGRLGRVAGTQLPSAGLNGLE